MSHGSCLAIFCEERISHDGGMTSSTLTTGLRQDLRHSLSKIQNYNVSLVTIRFPGQLCSRRKSRALAPILLQLPQSNNHCIINNWLLDYWLLQIELAPIAQWIERIGSNDRVGGSNPSGSAEDFF